MSKNPYAEWRAEQRRIATIEAARANIARLSMEVDLLQEQVYCDLAHQLVSDRAGRKILMRYRGCTERAWRLSCDRDGRYLGWLRSLGIDRINRVVAIARHLAGLS